ncbi:MAG: CPBP family intramembrane glutamic endopeptidase [Polyangiaceae bacterium]
MFHAAKLADAALFNLLGWLLLLPSFTALGLHRGLGALAPLAALAFTLPLLLCCAVLGSVIDAAQLALSRWRALPLLRFIGLLLGSLPFLYWFAAPSPGSLGDASAHWLGALPAPTWLPFSEPARALAAWRSEPSLALAWLALFTVEVIGLLGLGTLALRGLYQAHLLQGWNTGPRARRSAPVVRARRPLAGLPGAVFGQELLWLKRNPAAAVRLILHVAMVNVIGLRLVPILSALDPQALPGLGLLVLGSSLVLGQAFLLERERLALGYWGSLPVPITVLLTGKTLFIVVLAVLGALPAVLYTAAALPYPLQAAPALLFGGVCVACVACVQTSLWLSQVDPGTPVSSWRQFRRALLLGLFAYWLGLHGLVRLGSAPLVAVLAPLVTGVALAWACWTGAVARLPYVLDRSAHEARGLSVAHALVTTMIFQDQLGAGWAEGLRRQLPLAHVATLSFVFAVCLVLPASVSWLLIKQEVVGLRERLGLVRGRGLLIILREALLWSVPAIAFNLIWWVAFREPAVAFIQPPQQPPSMLGVLAVSPVALVLVGCIAVPLVEELMYRGLLYRSLRAGRGLVFSLLTSSMLFALDHRVAAVVPVFFAAVCMTLAFERSRSLYAAMLSHALYNGVAAWTNLHPHAF